MADRDVELAHLGRILAEYLTPASPFVTRKPVILLTGAVGAGKTALLRAFANLATGHGASLLGAVASRAERGVPFGIVRQLITGAGLGATTEQETARLLDEGARAWLDDEDDAQGRVARTAVRLGDALLEPSAGGPLVIAVDDVHHADVASLRCLAHLARRVPTAPVLLLLAEAPRIRPRHPEIHAELLRPTQVHRIRLSALTVGGVRAMLASQLDDTTADALAEPALLLSGGSPLLVNALVEDHLAEPVGQPGELVAGEFFREAVISCLYRCELTVLKAARALAVTGEEAGVELIPHLVDAGFEVATSAVNAATSAGLVEAGRLRHQAVRQAVLDGMTTQERATLHRQVAGLMHRDGCPADVVAHHLVSSGMLDEPWMAEVVLEAGEQILLDGDVELALRYLRLANRHQHDERQQARVRAALAQAEWRLDPHAAIRHLPGMVDAIHAGHLTSELTFTLLRYLLWHGQVDEAVDLLRYAGTGRPETEPQAAAELMVALRWMYSLYPALMASRRDLPAPSRDRIVLLQVRERLLGAAALASVLRRGGESSTIGDAEQILRTADLDERGMWTTIWALVTLILADRLQLASDWCVRLRERSHAHHHPIASALIATMRAEIAARLGDLPEAQQLAEAAMSHLSPKSWGIGVGLPLAVGIRAATGQGRLDEAAEALRLPVPPAMFETPFALFYLQARGHYSLLAGNPESALNDFQLVGELMTAWRLDLPALIAWRTDMARACLGLGRPGQAGRLAREDLSRLKEGHLRPRGAALRVLAATLPPAERVGVLQEAIGLLERCGDRLELAHSLSDLGNAFQAIGEHRQARGPIRVARTLAEQSHVPLTRPPDASGAHPDPGGQDAGLEFPSDGLSAAEARVAGLAAQGHTNREIAAKLFLTISTIEQHLTRVYRKLDVASRGDLAARLRLRPPGAAPGGGQPEPGYRPASTVSAGPGRPGGADRLAAVHR